VSAPAVSVWDQPLLADPLGTRLEADLQAMVRSYEAASARNQQTDLGPSEIGNPCTRCLAEQILGATSTWGHSHYDDGWRAIVGTAVHNWLEEAAVADCARLGRGRWYPEVRVQPDERLLPSGGSCDLFDSDTNTVIDHKTTTKTKLTAYRLNGPGVQYQRQAHLYGLGYSRAGHDVQNVALAFWLRDGMLRDLYVWTEPYDEHLALATLERYDTLREICAKSGPAILAALPSDPDCDPCARRERAAQA
jgi:hypothetical protein